MALEVRAGGGFPPALPNAQEENKQPEDSNQN